MNDRHVLGRELHPEIAPGDHDSVGSLHDCVEVRDRGRLFQFRHKRCTARNNGLDLFDIGDALHEGERDNIHTDAQSEIEIGPVLFCQGTDRQGLTAHRKPFLV